MAQQLQILQAEIIGNRVDITFALNTRPNTRPFCLSVFPVRKTTTAAVAPSFAKTCNALVQLVLQANTGTWHFSRGQSQIQEALHRLAKPELLALCRAPRPPPQDCSVQLHLCHAPRPCELHPDDNDQDGPPVLRLRRTPPASDLDREEEHFYRMYTATAMCHVPASAVCVTPATRIDEARIHGPVRRAADGAVYHCIAARDASARGARRWACPARRQLLARQALQAADEADDDNDCLRVPELLAYVYDDDDDECPQAVRPSRIMGGLYEHVDGGTPLRAVLAAARPGEPDAATLRILAARVAGMVGSLHRRGFVWGGESGDTAATTLIDCLVVDGQGNPWLVDGFCAAYHDDAVRSDNKALLSLLGQMKAYYPEAEGGGWSDHPV